MEEVSSVGTTLVRWDFIIEVLKEPCVRSVWKSLD